MIGSTLAAMRIGKNALEEKDIMIRVMMKSIKTLYYDLCSGVR